MKPKKIPGCDEIPFELIKYAPDRIHEQIGKLYNSMAETGKIQKEVTYGILKPLQKQSKRSAVKSEIYYHTFLPTQDPCSMYTQQN